MDPAPPGARPKASVQARGPRRCPPSGTQEGPALADENLYAEVEAKVEVEEMVRRIRRRAKGAAVMVVPLAAERLASP